MWFTPTVAVNPIRGMLPIMEIRLPIENTYRERVSHERRLRAWSQAELAKMLADKGIKGIYTTTVAKIESGERAVRIHEAAALADIFDTTVDSMLGRRPAAGDEEFAYALRQLRDGTAQHRADLQRIAAHLNNVSEDVQLGCLVPANLTDEWQELTSYIDRAIADLEGAQYLIGEVADSAGEILTKKTGVGD